MPDFGPVVGALLEVVGPVLGVALRALLRTVVGMVLLVALSVGGSMWLAANGSVWRALIAGVACGVLGVVLTGVLTVKNTVLRGVIEAVERVALGARAVRLVFSVVGVNDESHPGERLGAVGRAVERVPLRDAEQKLRAAVEGLLKERSEKTGVRAWVARKLMQSVLERVEAITLARFRADDAQFGGVDLLKLRDELGGSIDGRIATQVRAQALRLTGAVVGAYAVAAVLIGLLVARLPV